MNWEQSPHYNILQPEKILGANVWYGAPEVHQDKDKFYLIRNFYRKGIEKI